MPPHAYISPGGSRYLAPAPWFIRRALLPYGRWTCQDGREVLFNRFYEPIWQRQPSGIVEAADGREWVKFIGEEWFYSDRDETETAKRSKAIPALLAWGLPVPSNADAKAYRENKPPPGFRTWAKEGHFGT